MDANAPAVVLRAFSGMRDPRRHNVRHLFADLMTVALLAVMCRSDDWDEVVIWGRANEAWLRTFLELPHGIASEDTFSRLFARLDPNAFEAFFIAWTKTLATASEGRLIALDGKTLRCSMRRAWDHQLTHMVSAWCEQNQLVLGQLSTEGKSNEITVIPKLLALLDVKGSVVTIDAMGCQKEIAQQIVAKGGDYVLAVKGNQPGLERAVQAAMKEVELDQAKHQADSSSDYFQKSESGHDRLETRRVWVGRNLSALDASTRAAWPTVRTIGMVQCTRQVLGDVTGKISTERRWFISSLKNCTAQRLGELVRGHWGVENKLHWRLDTSFNDDKSRVRKDHGAENLSRLRRMAMNKLRTDRSNKKLSVKNKRYKCSLDRQYLIDMIQR